METRRILSAETLFQLSSYEEATLMRRNYFGVVITSAITAIYKNCY
jgi:hypothetical protein